MCEYICEKAVTLKKHMNTKHVGVSYKCNKCYKEFQSMNVLEFHMSLKIVTIQKIEKNKLSQRRKQEVFQIYKNVLYVRINFSVMKNLISIIMSI